VLFIGTQFSNLYTAVDSPARADTYKGELIYEAYEVKKKGKFMMSFTSPDFFLNVFVMLRKKRKKSPTITRA
jgi:hypothetical protein